MIISRHNYESYFLLYVDNELSVQDRNAVDNFVRENPDLKKELDLLGETTLPEEELKFDGKASLYKEEANVMQENLLLYLDNELDAAEAEKIAAKINTDVTLKEDWNILQRTQLDKDDSIVFEDKASLYRRERRPVIALRVWRIAAAAAVIAAALFIGDNILFSNKPTNEVAGIEKNGDSSIAANKGHQEIKKQVLPNAQDINSNNQDNNTSTDASTANTPSTNTPLNNNVVVKDPVKNTIQKDIQHNRSNVSANKNDQPRKKHSPVNDPSPDPSLDNINKQASNQSTAQNVEPKKDGELQKKVLTNVVVANEPKQTGSHPLKAPDIDITNPVTNSYANATVMSMKEEPENNNTILFVKEDKVTRSKLGGFIRKIKRTVERKMNIKPGKNVKIAGFEIASK